MSAARIVYQISILSSIVAIVRIPYNAAIIAHERMNIYAYVSILEAFLKLFIVYLLVVGEFDKLIWYSVLMFIVTSIITYVYRVYCVRNFMECKFKLTIDKQIIKPMLSYSGWDLYGNLSVMARGHGINIMLNMFFGPIINAASGIGTQVQNAIASFADNFLTAVRPQIVKNYASGNVEEMLKLIFNASKFSFLLLFVISFPLIIENRYVLNLWLKNVPEYAVIFCKLSLINNLVSIMFRTVSFAIHATGRVKRISLLNGSIYLTVIPISYIMLKFDYSPVAPYIINILLLFVGCSMYLITLRNYIPEFSILSFINKVIIKGLLVAVIASVVPLVINQIMDEGFIRLLLVILTTLISTVTLIYFVLLDEELRYKVRSFLKNII